MKFSMNEFGFFTDSPTCVGGVVKKSHRRWKAMIERCYDTKNINYKTYGAKGVYICDSWRYFSNFERWYDENYIEGYQIDKDILGKGYYGPDACIFVSPKENVNEMVSRRIEKYGQENPHSKPKEYYAESPTTRSNFSTICKRNGWNKNDFNMIYSGITTSGRHKKYFYVYCGDTNAR